jgi:hypothetical protein
LAGWEDLTGTRLEHSDLTRRWQTFIALGLGLRIEPGDLTATEREQATALVNGKYGRSQWNDRR